MSTIANVLVGVGVVLVLLGLALVVATAVIELIARGP